MKYIVFINLITNAYENNFNGNNFNLSNAEFIKEVES
jgi:hypothetical protein